MHSPHLRRESAGEWRSGRSRGHRWREVAGLVQHAFRGADPQLEFSQNLPDFARHAGELGLIHGIDGDDAAEDVLPSVFNFGLVGDHEGEIAAE